MQVRKSSRFNNELEEILNFIAQDSLSESFRFLEEIEQKLENIKEMPFMYRKSKKSDNENIRDMIHKKYVIPYKVYKDEILILGIFSQNKWDV